MALIYYAVVSLIDSQNKRTLLTPEPVAMSNESKGGFPFTSPGAANAEPGVTEIAMPADAQYVGLPNGFETGSGFDYPIKYFLARCEARQMNRGVWRDLEVFTGIFNCHTDGYDSGGVVAPNTPPVEGWEVWMAHFFSPDTHIDSTVPFGIARAEALAALRNYPADGALIIQIICLESSKLSTYERDGYGHFAPLPAPVPADEWKRLFREHVEAVYGKTIEKYSLAAKLLFTEEYHDEYPAPTPPNFGAG